MKKITILAAVVALLGSCVQNTEDTINPNTKAEGRTIYATFDNEEEETKTYVENYKYLRWHEGDEISFFDATTYNSQYAFAGKDGDAEGEFNAVATGEGTAIATTYGVYPYNAKTSISEEGVISVELPAIQAYGVNSFGKGANTMVAVGESATDDKLFFKNACGYLVVKLYNESGTTVKSLVLKGNNEEKIAGAATITATHAGVPSVTMADTATTSVTIDCGEGVELGTTAETATEFWFALPETTFEGGITITATDTEGKEYEKTTTKPVVITRNNVQPMKALGAEFVATKPANNEIWYTATSRLSVNLELSKTNFGANIVKHTWNSENGKGIMIFDSDVTLIGDHAFKNRSMLTSITIPDSVKKIGYQAFWECSNLTKINIPQNVSSFGDDAFYCCTGEITISCNIPHYERSYTDSPFRGSRFSKIIIQDGVTSIGSNAFRHHHYVRSIVIPTSVTTIGKYAFTSCDRLEEIECDFVSDDGKCIIVNGTLRFFAPFGIKEYTIPEEVSFIESSVFYSCQELEKVTIPSSVKHIGNSAFGCSYNLKEIIISEGVETIGSNAFYKTAITSITFPHSVKSIGSAVVCGCENLSEIKGAFASVDNKYICVDNVFIGLAQAGVTEFEIPEGITTIGDGAFDWTYNLEKITLPSTINKIEWAFNNCDALTAVYCKAETPPAVYSDGHYFFAFPCPDSGNANIIFYVPENSYSDYTQYNAPGGGPDTISPANWYRVKDCIQPYSFQ